MDFFIKNLSIFRFEGIDFFYKKIFKEKLCFKFFVKIKSLKDFLGFVLSD